MIEDSGLSWTILRNGLYAELFGALLTWTDDGLASAFGDGALSAVARTDLAAAAAVVARDPSAHVGRTYDLVGEPITAAAVAGTLGVAHRTLGLGDYRSRLLADESLLPFQPPMLVSIAAGVRYGFLDGTTTHLAALLGRPPADPLVVAADAASATRPALR
ncbi:hypothetical protein [Nocardioides lijunqiniae]|uniref:hypothetical protein n=1 Tax=Nocardioides lijunqiniae TaxID=2760832 RepID=UPI001D0C9A6E|nr:hypothetical protein [Nocardioides lijunqiniae]